MRRSAGTIKKGSLSGRISSWQTGESILLINKDLCVVLHALLLADIVVVTRGK